MDKRYITVYDNDIYTTTCVCKEDVTMKQAIDQIAKYEKEHPGTKCVDFYLGEYDAESDDYIRVCNIDRGE